MVLERDNNDNNDYSGYDDIMVWCGWVMVGRRVGFRFGWL